MLTARKRSILLGLLLLAITLLLDQFSKQLILDTMGESGGPVVEITSFFNLALVWNYGISFGMFATGHQPLILIAVSGVIVVILMIWLYKNSSLLVACALGCVMGGAIGNILDRLHYGAVTDFLDFHLGPYHWPAFNIADSCIFIGVVLLCASSMFMPHHHAKESAP